MNLGVGSHEYFLESPMASRCQFFKIFSQYQWHYGLGFIGWRQIPPISGTKVYKKLESYKSGAFLCL